MRNYLDKTPMVSTTRGLNEHRNSTRYPLSAMAEIVESQTRTKMSARISDLSRTGCYAEMISPFPLGDLVKMRIMKNKTPFLAQAEVTNTSYGMGMIVVALIRKGVLSDQDGKVMLDKLGR